MLIVTPKHDVDLCTTPAPYFYLIGPVRGGGDWQYHMCLALERHVGECIIASPCRWTHDHPLKRHFGGTLGAYERQTDWEQVYIAHAHKRLRGCLVCWLPTESETDPRTDGGPYGRDTYGELGYFRGLLESRRGLPLVLGGSLNFAGLSVIRRNFDHTYWGEFPFYTSMTNIAKAAAEIALR